MQSLHARSRVVSGVFVAIVIVSSIAALSDLSLLQYLHGISSGEAIDEARADGIDTRQALLGLVQVALFLACAIVFSMWFYRAHKNLKAGGLKDLSYTPGWAVGGFFVPFLNLVRPFQVMTEVWAGSKFLSREVDGPSWKTVPPAPLVACWWALFLLTSFLGNISGRLMLAAEELGELTTAGWVTLASDLADIPAALVAMILVRRITNFQQRVVTPPQ